MQIYFGYKLWLTNVLLFQHEFQYESHLVMSLVVDRHLALRSLKFQLSSEFERQDDGQNLDEAHCIKRQVEHIGNERTAQYLVDLLSASRDLLQIRLHAGTSLVAFT